MNRLEERLAPLDGIAAVILWVAGVAVLQGKADQPSSDASPAQALRFFQVHTGTVLWARFSSDSGRSSSSGSSGSSARSSGRPREGSGG